MSATTKHRSIQGTAVTLEYNKNIASRDKSDQAFKMHHLTWISGIRRENLLIDPMNDNSVQQTCNDFAWQMEKAKCEKTETLRRIHLLKSLVKPKGFLQRVTEFFVVEIKEEGVNHGL